MSPLQATKCIKSSLGAIARDRYGVQQEGLAKMLTLQINIFSENIFNHLNTIENEHYLYWDKD